MAVTGTQTTLDICTAALRHAGRTPWGQAAEAEDMAFAVGEIFRMLKAWQASDALWTRDTQSVALVTAQAAYTLTSPARPLRIHNARYKDANGYEMPMERMTADEYDALPDKASRGIPTTWFYDRKAEAGTLYVWPVPASATTETIEMRIEAEIEDITSSTDALDVPAEWYDAVVYGLAARLSSKPDARLVGYATEALAEARSFGSQEPLCLGW
ncbi:MAG: hypothetical protein GOVbin1573_45 [Prokaryotic dsDNA virus sp.]|nr:MAG: hypothetical protein GOVbin1573_45 [Prokaryotic dsDNA virus sp.]|tara:strand:+ start:5276 stop:5917 length:642 start_codon:yes stop_codon:yes gene_type:complete